MAAQTLTAKQKKAAVRSGSKKKVTMKSVLFGPYTYTWPRVDPKTEKAVLEELSRTFETLNMKRPTKQNTEGKEKKKSQSGCKTKFTEEQQQLRGQLTIGLSGTTRALEKNELRLIVVNLSSSGQLHKHLIQLTAVHDCPAIAVHNLTQTLGPVLTVTSVVAIGFKKLKSGCCTKFDSLIEYIKKCAPAINVPWFKKTVSCTNTQQNTKPMKNRVDPGEPGLVHNNKETGGTPLKIDKHIYKRKPDDYYSRFYIYKKSKKSIGGEDYISFGNTSSHFNDDGEKKTSTGESYQAEADASEPSFTTHGILGDERIQPISDRHSNNTLKRKLEHYQSTTVGSLQSNPNKTKKKKVPTATLR